MKMLSRNKAVSRLALMALMLACDSPMFAQTSPLGSFVDKVAMELTGPIAMSVSLAIIVLGGIYLGVSDGRGKGAVMTAMFAVVIIMSAARMVGWLGA
jgi:type IV secretory pathway VirB2 component (pilin)